MLLLSVGIQPAASATHSSNLPALAAKSFQSQFSPVQIPLKSRPKICPSYSSQTLASSISNGDKNKIEATEKLGVVVKPMERPRLVLKFIWMEKNIGIAIDQVVIPAGGHGTIPLSPYYFWPRKDAWEELKVMLESKPWISNKHKVILLNQATDIINLWQQSAGELD